MLSRKQNQHAGWRWIVVVAAAALLLCVSTTRAQLLQCDDVSNSAKKNCGYDGISQDECLDKGCCWDVINPDPKQIPWCYYGRDAQPGTVTCSPLKLRNNCGFIGMNQSQCEQVGCCWSEVSPNPNNLPWCFYAQPQVQGYSVSSMTKTASGLSGVLQLLDGGTPNLFGPDLPTLRLDVWMETNDRVRVRVSDPTLQRWQVPSEVFPHTDATTAASSPAYAFSYTENPFGFAVQRLSDNSVLFNTTPSSSGLFNGLVFKDQFLEISSSMPQNATVYGLGESTMSAGLKLDTNFYTYTLWNRDTAAAAADQNLYGSHPFYMEMRDGAMHGVLLMNSNGMDVVLQPGGITYRVIGGLLDFYFFTGPSPADVVQQYQELIGLPRFPPYWSFGFHQSKYGYPNVGYVEEVVANYSAAGIPLDTIWSDIDYMDQHLDFTFDPVNYPVAEMKSFADQLHQNGQQYVVIVDPGIGIRSPGEYPSYDRLISTGTYIQDQNGNPFQGCVWPGPTSFPDFWHPNATAYWENEISLFLQQVPFDGLWIDMNEISNAFCTGECSTSQCNPPPDSISELQQIADEWHSERNALPSSHPSSVSRRGFGYAAVPNYTDPPYPINNGGNQDPLNVKTLDMDDQHYGGIIEYNAHNLYSLLEAKATMSALEKITNKRPFVLTRSSFVGSGNHTFHWTGDNASQWSDLYWSIVQMLNFQFFGIPMVGADICGFLDDTTVELCSRWIEVGAFYPFSRDHSTLGSANQELYRSDQVAAISRKVLSTRYSLVPYYYSLFFNATTLGKTVMRPLFFEFPQDSNTYGVDRQFMLGSALLFTPVLDQGATSVTGYFPAEMWYDWYTGAPFASSSTGSTVTLQTPIDQINIHVRGGSVIPMQLPGMTLAASRKNNLRVLAALDASGSAMGDMYMDDGVAIDAISGNKYTYVRFMAGKNYFKATVVLNDYEYPTSVVWDQVTVLGVSTTPNQVNCGSSSVPFQYNAGNLTVTLDSQALSLTSSFALSWQ
eukprot:CAMPEP_0177640502 /NCGR_PEP_ID=MMETSP0447-20121125/6576_1 /TAXON_ID=0 /ORGANISM="Stygamoeba regulata, Strain BSH-02190019" /LENGTH=1002 /DNA_ID=CAMNT_0019142575 /DNA_START=142 /DNA_END=3150 /DNA_ORIENTATION=-